jgi:hypothetical protein
MKKLVVLFIVLASVTLFAQQNNNTVTMFNNVSFVEAVDSTYTSSMKSLQGYNHVTYVLSAAGADSLRWIVVFDKKVGDTWELAFATDSLSYGGTGATDTYPNASGTLRVGATGSIQVTEKVRARLTATEVDSASATTFKLTLNLRE